MTNLPRAALTVLAIAVALLVFFLFVGSRLYTEWLWFESLGYGSVFLTTYKAKLAVGLVAGALFGAFLGANVIFARRLRRRIPITVLDERGLPTGLQWQRVSLLMLVALVAGSLVAGVVASDQWAVVLKYFNRSDFGFTDPLFGRDAAFYVFVLPMLSLVHRYLTLLLALSFIASAFIYFLTGAVTYVAGHVSIARRAKAHLAILAASYFLLKVVDYYLRIQRLVYSPRGVVFGASYTDIHAVLPVLRILMVMAALGAVATVVNIFTRGVRPFVVAVVALTVTSFLLGNLYPSFVQQVRVAPNEIAMERPFLEHNIAATRFAYGLGAIAEHPYPATMDLTYEQVVAERGTVENIRLWDWRALRDTYSQMQEIRLYYSFFDVDVDRYYIDGQYRQVMISARELVRDRLPAEAQTWVNRYLKFTHGFGVVMSPASEMTEDGLPAFLIKDIPPASRPGAPQITQPRVYFGELSGEHVIVNTREEEFDYPVGATNAYTRYDGRAGVVLRNQLVRALFAVRYGSYQMMLSGAITNESKILMYRDIVKRVKVLAPFLRYDKDPYVVIGEDGHLYWIMDGYTTSLEFPYSEPWRGELNYIRNSVKVLIHAYHGDTIFYVIDDQDPIIQTWRRIFPDLFRPFSEMPADLARHIRYPEDLFRIQAEMYAVYHMTDPVVFYNKEDLWEIPNELYMGKHQPMDPYYIIMTVPGEEQPEFLLMVPFTPVRKDNMIAWLAARCDPPKYGELFVYRFPKERLIFGPMQIEARIDQEPEISQLLTLWGQLGSDVIRGNLLVIPINDSIIYVEPLYLQAEATQLPELKRVIVAYGDRVAMDTSVDAALRRVFGEAPAVPEEPTAPGAPPEALTAAQLAERARQVYQTAQERLRSGDWAGYGQAIEELGQLLERLERLLQSPEGGSP